MSNMSELDAATTWQGDESRTEHEDGSVTYVRPISYLDLPAYVAYVAYTYRGDDLAMGVASLIHGPDFAKYRETLMGGLS